jgi:rsbT co-antagonist protein RsbR
MSLGLLGFRTVMKANSTLIPEILEKNQEKILNEWISEQTTTVPRQRNLMKEPELRQQCTDLLAHLMSATRTGRVDNFQGPEWDPLKHLLAEISRSRAIQGFTPSETATFVLSIKKPLFSRIQESVGNKAEVLAQEMWVASELVDKLGLYTSESYLKAREGVIMRQQTEMLELSTPVVKLWEGVLALPLIGTLDSSRTQVVMETLLEKIVETGSTVAIIDITGVPTVDTLVAQHLIKTITAARLMGADCIISGIRPQIAQTIVHLGVALGDVCTKANLADAFAMALRRLGVSVVRNTGAAEAGRG